MSEVVSTDVHDITSFCNSHKISRALFYLLLKEGRGPRIMKAGRRTLISKEAAADWRQRMERESSPMVKLRKS